MSQTDQKNLPQEKTVTTHGRASFHSYAEALKVSQKEKSASATAGDSGNSAHQHKVEAVEEDGVVNRIKVTCTCGEVIEIDCGYTE
jgi:hypothetical protein